MLEQVGKQGMNWRELMSTNENQVMAVDFDGVICEEGAWPEIGKPIEIMIKFLLERQAEGARLILSTCRDGEALDKAVDFCESRGIYFEAVNDNLPDIVEEYGSNPRKIYADVYIDDKAINSADLIKNIQYSNKNKLSDAQLWTVLRYRRIWEKHDRKNVLIVDYGYYKNVIAVHNPGESEFEAYLNCNMRVHRKILESLKLIGLVKYVDKNHNEVSEYSDNIFGIVLDVSDEVVRKYGIDTSIPDSKLFSDGLRTDLLTI